MEILNTFGFDIQMLIAQVINFLILAFIFKKFLYKPILSVLNERKTRIEQGLKDAENAHVVLEKAESQKDEILKRTGLEAESILKETRKSAEEIRNQLLDAAKKDAEKIIANSRLQAQIESERIQKEAKTISVDIASKILENAITGLFEKGEQEKIIKRGIRHINEQNKQ